MTPVPGGAEVDRDPGRIAAMFSDIAGRYDLMNRLMTAGLDGRWRGAAAAEAALEPGDEGLDVCCGTGDLAIELARRYPQASVIGVDFSAAMLALARDKAARTAPPHASLDFVDGDLLALPFADGRFAAVTVAFGVRNVPDLPRALREMVRVTASGGRIVILEITQPHGQLGRRFHGVWFDRCVPRLGALVAGGGAYSYLPASVRSFPPADILAGMLVDAGLHDVRFRRFGMGIIALHVGVASGSREGR